MKKFSIVFKSGLTLNVMSTSALTAVRETLKEHINLSLRDIKRVNENKFSKFVPECDNSLELN